MKEQVKISSSSTKKLFGPRIVSKALVLAVVRDFKKTNLYSKSFLKDLKVGLGKSNYKNNF